MQTWQFILIIICILLSGGGAVAAVLLTHRRDAGTGDLIISVKNEFERSIEASGRRISEDTEQQIRFLGENMRLLQNGQAESQTHRQEAFFGLMTEKQAAVSQSLEAGNKAAEERFRTFEGKNAADLAEIRETMERRLAAMQAENDRRMQQMRETVDKSLADVRATVDEKLQETLNARITESFRLVNERLAEVYRGLGEMKTLASGVGDLKRVLSNVKTRGTLGEVQLGAILEEILAPSQYEKNFDAKRRSRERVEYAVKLPGAGDEPVWLPIDSKFPADAYTALADAYDSGDPDAVAQAQRRLADVIMRFARDIRDKYVDPPRTTEFAVMFLPTEGIYAEVVRMGMVERLQREARVNVAGPSTMAALLNSLRMGFSIVAMQQRSAEAWQVLGAVKNEFMNFEKVLTQAQSRISSANDELEKLIGTRTRAILRKLRDVETLPSENPAQINDAAE